MTVVEGRAAATVDPRGGTRVRVRLSRSVLRTAVLSFSAAMVPLTPALWAEAQARGNWGVVAGLELFLLLGCLTLALRRRMVYVEVTDTLLSGNGIASPLEHVRLDTIASVHLVPTYVLGSTDAVTQLLVLDAAGRRLFRMRGTYWEQGDLELIAAALPKRAHLVREPVRLSEFFAQFPSSEYWFENKPIVRVLSVLGVCALSVALAITVMWGA